MDQGRRDWRELAEALPQIVWTAGPDGRVDFISQDFYRYTGVDPSRAGARNWLPAIHPDDRIAIRQVWQHAVASVEEFQYEVRIASAATGEYRWHLASGKPVSDGAGNIRWYGAALDIHDRKLAEEALQSREERLRAIVEGEPECVKIVSPEGILVDMNPAGLRMIEADVPDQALGQPVGRLIHPEDRDAFRRLHRQAMSGENGQLAFRIIGLKGSERWMETHSTPLRGPDGTVDGVLSVTRDITGRRSQEQALLEAQGRNRLILASIADGVHGLDQDGRVVFENPAAQAMLGYAEEELLGAHAHDRLHHRRPDGRSYPVEECPIYQTLQDGRTRHARDEHFVHKDGSLLPVEFTAAAMTGDGGTITGVVVTFRDVSGRKRDEALRALESRVLESIAGGEPLTEILEEITRTVDRLNPGGMSSVVLVDESGHLRHGAAPGLPSAWIRAIDGLAIGPEAGSCGTAAYRRETVIATDIATDPLWRKYRSLATAHGLRACWSVPVLIAPDRVAASFAIYYREPRAPGPWEEEFIHRIASFLRVAFERSQQNERLRASELRYRSIYDLVPVSIWEEDWSAVIALCRRLRNAGVSDLDRYFNDDPGEVERALGTVRILNFNDVTLRMFDAGTREEVLASMAELTASPAARDTLKAKLLALARGDRGFEAAMTLRSVTGRIVEVLLNAAFPPPDSDTGLVLVSVMDITSRRQAEQRFRIVAQATNDVIWDWNLLEDTVWWSDGMERQFGHRRESLPPDARSWTDNIHPEDLGRVSTSIHGVIDGGGTDWTEEYRFARADGGWSLIRDRGFVIRDAEGRAVRMVGSMVDHTEQRNLEIQLRQAQRLDAVGQLTGGVAHDFNNLLTVILGSAELLLDGLTHDPRLRALADMTRSAAIRGSELTNRLLAFARRQPLDPKPVNVNRLVADMDSLLRRTLGEQVELEIVQRGGLWSALADASQLENALLNLCINARDAMPEGGRLTIETANASLDDAYVADLPDVPPGQYVLVAVSDTGTGMDRDTLARAFEPFFTTKEVGKGSGLGLSMVYGFAKQSRGHVRIYSEPGQGTTVKLYLPRAAEAAREEAVRRPAGPAPGGSERILLVEDDDLVRSYVERQLKGMGYSVASARNGPEALEQLRGQAPFDLLFTDVIMPGGLSGRELAEQARTLYPTLPVLFTSGYTENAIVHHGRLDRGVHLLQKPYRRDELAAKVRKVLDESRREFPDL